MERPVRALVIAFGDMTFSAAAGYVNDMVSDHRSQLRSVDALAAVDLAAVDLAGDVGLGSAG